MRKYTMLTLVIYDISDDKKRTKLSRTLISYSLERIQYSAFKGELNSHDRFVLAKDIKKYLSKETDSIYIIPLCERCFSLVEILSESDKSLRDDQIKVI
jgi:CRISPR-associated protein Cas2